VIESRCGFSKPGLENRDAPAAEKANYAVRDWPMRQPVYNCLFVVFDLYIFCLLSFEYNLEDLHDFIIE